MKGVDLFDALVRFHSTYNLARTLEHIERHGGLYGSRGEPLQEGHENHAYVGAIIVANGDTLAQRLREGSDTFEPVEISPFEPIRSEEDLFCYLLRLEQEDGADVYNGCDHAIARASELPNNLLGMNGSSVYDAVPQNFVHHARASLHEGNPSRLGTKTRLAIRFPRAFENTHSYQIKHSIFGPTGEHDPKMGKVTRFGPQGLEKEFFLAYDPQSPGPFILPERGIVGVERTYHRTPAGVLVQTGESFVGLQRPRSPHSRELYQDAA